MPLLLATSMNARIVSPAVERVLRSHLDEHGEANLLVSKPLQILQAKKELAKAGLGIGVTVSTPFAWVSESWRLYGDGTLVAPDMLLNLCMKMQLDTIADFDLEDSLDTTMGTAQVLSEICNVVLPFLERADIDAMRNELLDASELLPREIRAIDMAWSGVDALRAKGYIPYGFAAALLVSSLPSHKSVVAVIDDVLDPVTYVMLRELSRSHSVALKCVVPRGNAGALVRKQVEEILKDVPEAVAIEEDAPVEDQSPEIASLRSALFNDGAEKIVGQGDVCLLEAAGKTCEIELVVRQVKKLMSEGCKTIAVVAPDAYSAFERMSQKLSARGVTSRVRATVPFLKSRAGFAFSELVENVSRLQALSRTWIEDVDIEGQLNDMTWWPPSGLVDAISSELASLPRSVVWKLDQEWRGNRILTPNEVLTKLENVSRSNKNAALDEAVKSIRMGRIGTAAAKLYDSLPATPFYATARGALDSASALADYMHLLGLKAEPENLEYNVRLFTQLMEVCGFSVSEELASKEGGCIVEFFTPTSALALEPQSYDALICMDMTTAGWPVKPNGDALSCMVARLDTGRVVDVLELERERFWRILGVAKNKVVLERSLLNADSDATYAAVMLTEVLSCYEGSDDKAIAIERMDEADVPANLSFSGNDPKIESTLPLSVEGVLSEEVRRFTCPPRNGEPEGSLPVLSASQIESYLECPLKWFTLRRLALSTLDAGFGAVETGSFMHRVLELAHTRLFDDAAAKIGASVDDAPIFVSGSRVSAANVDMYIDYLMEAFDEHLDHQVKHANKLNEQALVPHNAREQYRLEQLRRDLSETARFEAGIFIGFEPRYFELKFGNGDLEAQYAGAKIIGTVDRVDVDSEGRALIVDYKCKSGVFNEYALVDGEEFRPRHIQSLLYAKVLPKIMPELNPVGALYLGVGKKPEVSGAMADSVVERVYGDVISDKRREKVTPDAYGMRFDELVDATEDFVAEAIRKMLSGDIEANPRDKTSCSYCPVAFCEKRLS